MSDRGDINRLEEEIQRLHKRLDALKETSKTQEEEYEEVSSTDEARDIPSKEKTEEEFSEEPAPEESISRREWRGERYYNRGYNFGDRLGDYISGFVEDVMEGVSVELERSLFRDRYPKRISRKEPLDEKLTADIMSALGNEHRIKILDELSFGGKYASDLQERLSGISPSTLSSHLDVLQDAGLIYQERSRGRYLITIPGRIAVNMASRIAKRISKDRQDRSTNK